MCHDRTVSDTAIPQTLQPYPECTLLDVVHETACQRPNHPALLFKGARVSYANLERRIDACAAALAALGVQKGDRVALLVPNIPQAVIMQLGAWKAGAIAVPINPLYTAHELQRLLTECGAKTVVVLIPFYAKIKMEVNDPNAPLGPWYVTNGLLVEEMIVGAVQVGTQSFEPCAPSEEAVAGDPAADNPNAPTYRSFHDWSFPLNQDRAPDRRGQAVTTVLSKDGRLSDNPELVRHAATIGYYEPQIGHNIPKVFTDFFAQRGVIFENQRFTTGPILQDWVYVVGLPLSEPYWVRARTGGVERDVLVQVFERRVLTYVPDNPPEWRVEMGNVGRHYLHWRYGLEP